MKFGIIGLLPDQVNAIVRAYPNHDLEFLSREREREARSFASRHSKVVLMTKFISHSTQEAVPRHKRVLIHGGVTKLHAFLGTSGVTVFHKPVHKEPVMTPVADKKVDYKPLLAAKEGDVLEFHRPVRTTIAKWESQITSVRSYYRRHHGLKTEVSFKDSVASFLIVERTKPVKPQQEAAERPSVAPATTVSGNEADRQFWQQTFLARLNSALPIELAIQDADAALAAARSRFR